MKKIVFWVLAAALLVVSKAPLVSAQVTPPVLLIGGDSNISSGGAFNRYNDVWSSSGDLTTWNQVVPSGTASSSHFAPNQGDGGKPIDTAYLNGKLYLANGSNSNAAIWSSSDNGVTWTQIATPTAWARGAGRLVAFKNKLWMVGATAPVSSTTTSFSLTTEVWSSPDGITWTEVTANAPWSRAGFPVLVFKNKLWVLSGSVYSNDVYSSSDGATWTKTKVPWAGRLYDAAVVFQGKMWVFGGKDLSSPFSDAWSSADGVTWTLVTKTTPWQPNIYSAVISYNGKMFLFPGYTNEVWSSTDGANWIQIKVGNPTGTLSPNQILDSGMIASTQNWAPRIGTSVVVLAPQAKDDATSVVPVTQQITATGSISKSLSLGQSDSQVTVLQNYLIAHGYLSGTATGYYGAKTKLGVLAFQKKFGIAGGDGTTFGAKSRAVMSANN